LVLGRSRLDMDWRQVDESALARCDLGAWRLGRRPRWLALAWRTLALIRLNPRNVMTSADQRVYVLLSTVLGIVAVLWFLGVVLCREWVKNDLREKCFRPLSVRWCPFGWWGGYYGC